METDKGEEEERVEERKNETKRERERESLRWRAWKAGCDSGVKCISVAGLNQGGRGGLMEETDVGSLELIIKRSSALCSHCSQRHS